MGKILDRVWKSETVKGTIKFVLVAIATHADDKGECFPSLKLIASKTGYSVRHCQRLIDQLGSLGELEIVSGGGRKSNLYRFPKYMQDEGTGGERSPSPLDTYVTPDILANRVPIDTYVTSANDKCPPTLDTIVTPDILANVASIDTHVTPVDDKCLPTLDTVVTSPMTTVSTELKYNNNIRPLKAKSKEKSIVIPVGDDTAPKISLDAQTITPEGKNPHPTPLPVTPTPPAKITIIEGVAVTPSTPQPNSVDTRNIQTQPPPVAPPRADRPLSDHQRMTGAIVSAFGWTFKTMTRSNKSLVGKIAKELLEASATPDQIPDLYAFCKQQNWTGTFSPGALSSQWANFCATQSTSSGEIFPVWKPPPGYVGVKFDYPPPLVDPNNPDEDDALYDGLTTAEMREKLNQILAGMVEKMTIEETPIPDDDPLKEVLLW